MPIQNGTHYHHSCDSQVIATLEKARLAHKTGHGYRLRIYYGDPATGLWWGDTSTGYIGRSAGLKKIPIILWNKKSMGGPPIMDYLIVKIEHANKRKGGVFYDVIKQREEKRKQQPIKRSH